jgi:hypothetical protein
MAVGIDYPNVVDLVMTHEESGEVMLVIAHNDVWAGSPDELQRLGAKLNTYASYALDGQLVDDYPHAERKPVRIQLDCLAKSAGAVAAALQLAERQLAMHGLRLEVGRIMPH